jgi:hypothetical protein
MRVGVVGHRGYAGLGEILRTLLDIAPSLGLTLTFESELCDVAGKGERLSDPASVDALSRSAVTARSCAARVFSTVVKYRSWE